LARDGAISRPKNFGCAASINVPVTRFAVHNIETFAQTAWALLFSACLIVQWKPSSCRVLPLPASPLRFLLRHRALSAVGIPRSRGLRAAFENILHQSEFPKPANDQAGDVDFVPGVRDVGVAGKVVMVVVQAFAQREDRPETGWW
jgi:hypothetical protein